jgi:hypothetical protein
MDLECWLDGPFRFGNTGTHNGGRVMPGHTPLDRSIFMSLAVNIEENNFSQFLSSSKIFVLLRSICGSRTEISVHGISKAGEAGMTWHVIGRVPAQSRIIIQRWQILAIKIVNSCRPDPFACSSTTEMIP